MKRFPPPLRLALVLGVLVLSLPGCGSSVKVSPVRGKVTADGAPVTSGQVSYIPTSADQKGGMSAGQITSSGEYTIYTAGKEGAPLGTYKVTVTASMVPGGGKSMPTTPYSNKYSTAATTPLTIEVVANPEPGKYDLKLTSK